MYRVFYGFPVDFRSAIRAVIKPRKIRPASMVRVILQTVFLPYKVLQIVEVRVFSEHIVELISVMNMPDKPRKCGQFRVVGMMQQAYDAITALL